MRIGYTQTERHGLRYETLASFMLEDKMLEELRELVETASNPAMQTGRDLRGKTDQIKGRKSEEEQFI